LLRLSVSHSPVIVLITMILIQIIYNFVNSFCPSA
jgi:hypothetical protein